ncbi:MAG: UvrB/UvrC motif-containing protein [Kiritimatiellae bacterium]|nr:UvrB/UvrC motif-containing protein [Kiritimatiellia bacterium]
MLCQICGKKQATVHLTQMLNDEVRKMHLCEQCAGANGININAPDSVADFLLGLGPPKKSSSAAAGRLCSRCRTHFRDFKKLSRLGCQNCYAEFAEELNPLLQGMQKGARHVGKKPAYCPGAVNVFPPLASLKKTLDEAIASENYEEAARIRDQIRGAEQNRNSPQNGRGETRVPS